MPLYTWKCEKCQKEVEILRSIADYDSTPDAVEAGDCGKIEEPRCTHEWKKQISATNFKLMGRGWSADGYE